MQHDARSSDLASRAPGPSPPRVYPGAEEKGLAHARLPLTCLFVVIFYALLYLAVQCLVCPLYGLSQWYSLRSAINDGVFPSGERLERRDHRVNRSDEMRSFRQNILRGSRDSYTVVIGPHGCGKSTLIQDVLQDSAEGGAKGVVYVKHPDDTEESSLFDRLREAFGGLYLPSEYTFINSFSSHLSSWLSYIDWTPSNTFEDTIILLNEVIETKARDYFKNAGHRFVLIIDEANRILHSKTGLKDLHSLQRHMKRAADIMGGIHFILVDSAGVLVSRLREKSACSRMDVEEIQDLNRDAAEDLMGRALADRTDMKINISQVYEKVTGGRLILIWEAVEYIRDSHKSSTEDVSRHVGEAVGLQEKLDKCSLTDVVNGSIHWEIVKYLMLYDKAYYQEIRFHLKEVATFTVAPKDVRPAVENLIKCDIIFRHVDGDFSLYSAIVRSSLQDILNGRYSRKRDAAAAEKSSSTEEVVRTDDDKREAGKEEL